MIGQVFMSGHVGSGNAEFSNLRQPIHAQRKRTRQWNIKEGSDPKIGGKPSETGLPGVACAPIHTVTGRAVALKEPLPVAGIGRCNSRSRRSPTHFRNQMLHCARLLQTLEVSHKIIPSLVAKEIRIRGHDRSAADLRRIIEVGLEPKGRTSRANLREVGPLTPIADQRRMLQTKLQDGLSRPHMRTSAVFGRTYWEWQWMQPSEM